MSSFHSAASSEGRAYVCTHSNHVVFGKELLLHIFVAWHAGHLGGRALVLAEAFAGGALFSAGLLHLLADAIEELEKLGEYPWAELLCAVGCLSTHGLETITSLLWKAHLA